MDSMQFTNFTGENEGDSESRNRVNQPPEGETYLAGGTGATDEGNTPTGEGEDNTIEDAPESGPGVQDVTTNVDDPETDPEGGGGGGIGGTSTTNAAPQQPSVVQTGVAQSDPTLATPNPLAPPPEPTAANIPPLDLDETQTIDEDGVATGNVLLNVEDPDGGPAVVTQFTIPGDPTVYQPGQTATIDGIGTITIAANGDYTFTPVADYNGSVPPITYALSDQAGGTATSTLSITVTPVNDPPVDGDESQTINEDNPATGNVLLNVVDPDGGTPVVTQFSVPGDSTVYTAGQTATI
ncbi:cadherin-like domain-containing protein, partial [Cyanobium sp. BA5m-21]